METDDNMHEWSDDMWNIWHNGEGTYHINDKPYEFGFDKGTELAWIHPRGKEEELVYSNVRRDDPSYVNGTEEFRNMVETVRLVHNLINAKGVIGKLAAA